MIYFDNNATTRVADEVVARMLPYLTEHYGNPSAGYRFAKECRAAIQRSREQVASYLDAEAEEIVFTGCGTESNNAAIASALRTQAGKRHVITTAVEHSAILKFLADQDCDTTILPVDEGGRFSLDDLEAAIRPDTALVTAMLANNETGVISPAFEAAELLKARGILFHTDAVNASGKIPLTVRDSGIHMLSLSGHKFHAPKGIGVLFVNRHISFHPLLFGGGQENGRRSGTEAVPNIVAIGAAAELSQTYLNNNGTAQLATLRDRFEQRVIAGVDGVQRNGSLDYRLPNTAHLSFENLDAGEMLVLLDQKNLYCSSGSACSTGEAKPSHVMTAMGHDAARAKSSLRFSFSRYNTIEEVDQGADIVIACALKLHALKQPDGGLNWAG